MGCVLLLFLTAGILNGNADSARQDTPSLPAAAGALATVEIPRPVLADGKPLSPGRYELRVAAERPTPLVGQSPDAQRWVEFVANGAVVGREIAEILRDDDRPSTGASSEPARQGTRVEMLKEGQFLRISVTRAKQRYLVYLPVAGAVSVPR
jgi:hypothetical protein